MKIKLKIEIGKSNKREINKLIKNSVYNSIEEIEDQIEKVIVEYINNYSFEKIMTKSILKPSYNWLQLDK